jgi:hypothetical protein
MLNNLDKNQISIVGHNLLFKFNNKTQMGFETIRNNKVFTVSPDIEYKYNEFGYRSKQFIENEDLLIAGCSHSFGLGIPENEIWGSILSKKINKSFSNLSMVGASANTLVQNLFAFFREFKNPKILCVLFPEFNRIHFPNSKKILKNDINFGFDFAYSVVRNNGNIEDRPKYSKIPHKIEDIIPNEAIFYINSQAILNLEKYCNDMGIKFFYSIWNENSVDIIKNLKKINNSFYNGFIETDLSFFPRYKTLEKIDIEDPECHEHLKKLYGDRFYYAEDHYESYVGHFNSHIHYHLAENFYKEIIKNAY